MILLKEKREEKKMSQAELAEESGVSQQAISAIESGSRKNVGVETLQKLAGPLECTVADLFVPDQRGGI